MSLRTISRSHLALLPPSPLETFPETKFLQLWIFSRRIPVPPGLGIVYTWILSRARGIIRCQTLDLISCLNPSEFLPDSRRTRSISLGITRAPSIFVRLLSAFCRWHCKTHADSSNTFQIFFKSKKKMMLARVDIEVSSLMCIVKATRIIAVAHRVRRIIDIHGITKCSSIRKC